MNNILIVSSLLKKNTIFESKLCVFILCQFTSIVVVWEILLFLGIDGWWYLFLGN